MCGRDLNGNTHWWLKDGCGKIIDITAAQYIDFGLIPPYNNGVGRGFLTKLPSKRTQIVIDRVTLERRKCSHPD